MASTRTRAKTKAELNAEEGSKAAAARQAAKLKAPSAAALAKASAKAVADAAAAQPKDNKQARGIGIVARGHTVMNEGRLKFPGEIVRAQPSTIDRLRTRGVLVDEGRVAKAMLSDGPRVLQMDEAAKHAPEPR